MLYKCMAFVALRPLYLYPFYTGRIPHRNGFHSNNLSLKIEEKKTCYWSLIIQKSYSTVYLINLIAMLSSRMFVSAEQYISASLPSMISSYRVSFDSDVRLVNCKEDTFCPETNLGIYCHQSGKTAAK